MIQEYKLSLVKGSNEIIFRYIEAEYPITDTKVFMYDMYKLNIMLSDGLAAILRETNDIYNSFSGDLFFFNPEEIHNGRILRQGVHRYIEILIPRECFPEFKSYDFLFNDSSSKRTNVLSPSSKERTLILSLAEKIIDFIRSPLDNILLLSYLTELLMICTRLYGDNEKRDVNQNIPAALNSAMIFMQENFSENIRMEEIA